MTLEQHHEAVMDKLHDIDEDTDCILKELGGKNMGEGFDSGALIGMLANKGVDPSVIAMLENCKRDGNWGDNGMLIVLFLILILGFGGNGGGFFGNRNNCAEATNIDRTIFNQSNFDILNSAISTQGTRQEMAVNQLANALNCDCNSIKSALCGLDKQLAMTNGSVINAIQNMGCQIGHQISECCCRTNANLDKGFCGVNQSIQGLAYQMQTTDAATRQLIQQSFCDQNAYLAQQFCDIKMREDQREIQQLRDEVQRQRENANTALILQAIQNKDVVAGTFSTSAGTFTGSLS